MNRDGERPPCGDPGRGGIVETLKKTAGVPGEVHQVIECPVSLLRIHKERLIEVLSKHPGLVVQRAHSQGLLSRCKYLKIRSICKPCKKTEKLLDYIIGKGKVKAQAFIELLRTLQDDFPTLPAELLAGVPGEVHQVIECPVSLLRIHKERLIEVLSKHPGLVVQRAHSQGLLSWLKYMEIRSINDPGKKTEKLLDYIIGKGKVKAFIELLRTLQDDFPTLPAELLAGVPGEVEEVIESPVSLLRTQKVRLIEVLSNDHSLVVQEAHSKGLLSDRKYKNIRSINDPNEKIAELLDFIMGKGNGVAQEFIDLLRTLQDDFPTLPAELLGVNRN